MQRLYIVISSPCFASASFILKGITNYFKRNIDTEYLFRREEDRILTLNYLDPVNLKKKKKKNQPSCAVEQPASAASRETEDIFEVA